MDVLVADSVWWTLLVVNFIPFLVSFVSNTVTRKGVKEALLAILAGVAAIAAEITEAGGFVWEDVGTQLIALFLGSVGMFWGWQHRTVSPSLERSGLSLGAPKA